jgi:NAD(P)-dependent dehydrogenase (short-subunit alcohol dehydrogenase family)
MAGIQTVDVTTGESGGMSKPGDGTFSYGPSKAACIHLTKLQASKMMSDHITVNVICPGVFPSRMTNFGLGNYGNLLAKGQPSGRVGVPADFAGTVLYLSSIASAHATGNVIELDGGSSRSGMRGKALASASSAKL